MFAAFFAWAVVRMGSLRRLCNGLQRLFAVLCGGYTGGLRFARGFFGGCPQRVAFFAFFAVLRVYVSYFPACCPARAAAAACLLVLLPREGAARCGFFSAGGGMGFAFSACRGGYTGNFHLDRFLHSSWQR